ncbi:hypothetical protein JOL62DRAFT_388110 [Phyllosticta paracitricarpa]|uniref:Zn(2)-C6 fungal-type domain-containing protein n=1 Tax=Phyllosticta paracitricarpa TaxID=2016321 RepID=A0ABR1NHA3_9PEZI
MAVTITALGGQCCSILPTQRLSILPPFAPSRHPSIFTSSAPSHLNPFELEDCRIMPGNCDCPACCLCAGCARLRAHCNDTNTTLPFFSHNNFSHRAQQAARQMQNEINLRNGQHEVQEGGLQHDLAQQQQQQQQQQQMQPPLEQMPVYPMATGRTSLAENVPVGGSAFLVPVGGSAFLVPVGGSAFLVPVDSRVNRRARDVQSVHAENARINMNARAAANARARMNVHVAENDHAAENAQGFGNPYNMPPQLPHHFGFPHQQRQQHQHQQAPAACQAPVGHHAATGAVAAAPLQQPPPPTPAAQVAPVTSQAAEQVRGNGKWGNQPAQGPPPHPTKGRGHPSPPTGTFIRALVAPRAPPAMYLARCDRCKVQNAVCQAHFVWPCTVCRNAGVRCEFGDRPVHYVAVRIDDNGYDLGAGFKVREVSGRLEDPPHDLLAQLQQQQQQ